MKNLRKKILFGAFGLMIGASVISPAYADGATLYDRLGGMDAINAVLDQFFVNNYGDSRIAEKWATTDLPRLKEYIGDMLCEAAGGPCAYYGSSLEVAHAGMNITADEFAWTAGHLSAALDSLGVKDPEKSEVMTLVGSLQSQIVGK